MINCRNSVSFGQVVRVNYLVPKEGKRPIDTAMATDLANKKTSQFIKDNVGDSKWLLLPLEEKGIAYFISGEADIDKYKHEFLEKELLDRHISQDDNLTEIDIDPKKTVKSQIKAYVKPDKEAIIEKA